MRSLSRWIILVPLVSAPMIAPVTSRAGGTGVSWSGDYAGQPSIEADTTKVFYRYRVPESQSALARRDIEFLWSPRYQLLSKPLDPGTAAENDLDRLGKSISQISQTNPFSFPFTDIQLVYDYLNFANATYNQFPALGPGFVIAGTSPAYDIPNRSHVDTYLYYPGGAPNGDWPALNDRGAWRSDFKSPNEDVSTGRDSAITAVLDTNSVSLAGPFASQVGDTTSARWTRPDARANAQFDHEFQHMFNVARPSPGSLTEIFSSAAEALAGEIPDVPRFDVPFTWSLIRGAYFGGLSNYAAWRSFTAYLAYNFRGSDTTSAGRTDDLLWRWAHHPVNNLAALGDRLTDAECGECAAKAYFAGLPSGRDRLQLLIHNWRVATYVNNAALTGDGQYGYAPQFGFVPSRDVGWWQNVDQLAADDSINIPPEITVTSAQRTRELTFVGNTPASPGSIPHLMALDVYGSEYWIIHSDASLATPGNDLVVTVYPEGVTRGFFECGWEGGRLMASLVGYNGPADSLALPNSLWRHPEYATTALAPSWVDVDSAAGAVEMVLSGFGTTYKAAAVVISLVDGAYGAYSFKLNADYEQEDDLSYRLNTAIRNAPYQTPNPQMVAGLPGVADAHPTWSPAGDEIAFFSTNGSPYAQIFRHRLSETTMTPIAPQPHNQYAPDWSPRGDLVAFEQELKVGPDGSDIWIKNLQTGDLYQATNLPGFATWPVFQPNGQRLAYLRFPGSYPEQPELRRVDVNGANDVLLATLSSSGVLGSPRWTPDGSWIYVSRADTLFAVPAGGGMPIPRPNLARKVTNFDFSMAGGPIVLEEPGQALAVPSNRAQGHDHR